MSDPFFEIEPVARAICGAADEAVRRYAEVSGLPVGEELIESFIPSFVFHRLGDQYAMTLEMNTRKLLARDGLARGRATAPESGRAAALEAEIRQLDSTERIDLVIYRGQEGERSQRPFLALVEFKLWSGWSSDRTKLLRILGALETCPFGIMCFIAQGAATGGWLDTHGDAAQQSGDLWLPAEMAGVTHRGHPLSIGAQIMLRPEGAVPADDGSEQ